MMCIRTYVRTYVSIMHRNVTVSCFAGLGIRNVTQLWWRRTPGWRKACWAFRAWGSGGAGISHAYAAGRRSEDVFFRLSV